MGLDFHGLHFVISPEQFWVHGATVHLQTRSQNTHETFGLGNQGHVGEAAL